MAQAFADVSELLLLADHLDSMGPEVDERAKAFIVKAGDDMVARMRDEVPVDSGDTKDSIDAQIGDNGMSVSVGPTNVDGKGRPVGFFIEHGAYDIPPDPFVLRTAVWAEGVMPDRAAEIVTDIL